MNDERGTGWGNRSFRGNRGGRWRGGDRGSHRGGRKSFRGSQHNSYGNFGDYRKGRGAGSGGGGDNWGAPNICGYRNKMWQNNQCPDTPGKRLSEEDIGVTEYMSDHAGFSGIIKSRYSDFQVSEINEEGKIAELTNLSPPAAPTEEAVDEDDLLLSKYNVEILPMETWDSINKLAVSEQNTDEKVEIDVSGMSKEQRTKIHDAVKKAFGVSIVGSTVNIDDKKLVRFEKYRKGVRIDNRVKWSWPGEYVYFIVYKENCDTMDAALRITERLRLNIKPSMLGYAGTKDRRAKTSQWFSLRKVDPRRVAAACRELRDLLVGDYTFHRTPLRLGALRGNRFRIALRNVTADDSVVDEAGRRLRDCGFINYYGLQRFGTRIETPTYQIGVHLLKGNYKEAIGRILEPRAGVASTSLDVYARTNNAAAALAVWPRGRHAAEAARTHAIELRLLRALAACPTDLIGALSKLARNTRLLYLHSYQSLVWNLAASERLRRRGLMPAVGDLVLADGDLMPAAGDLLQADGVQEEEIPIDFGDENDDNDANDDTDKSEQGDGDGNKMADDNKILECNIKPEMDGTANNESKKVPVKVLTQEDVDSGKYSIFDIILPLPGYLVEYPPNMKEFYEELLAKDGLKLEMKNKIKSYSMSGAYRRLSVRPSALHYRTVAYSDPRADLLLSDRDRIEGTKLHAIIPDGKYKALLLEMTLPASCYATMALRELLKVDTSGDYQASQNNYYKKNVEVAKTESAQKEAEVKSESEKSEAEKNGKLGGDDNKGEASGSEEMEEEKEGKRKIEDQVDGVEAKKI